MHTPDSVLRFWFPDGLDRSAEAHGDYMRWAFQGGADEAIVRDWRAVTEAGFAGELDGWSETAQGRLALILVLDQFPRSLYRDTPDAYGRDLRALEVCEEGLDNGHYEQLPTAWERVFYTLPLVHAEGPRHLERLDRCIELAKEMTAMVPAHLKPIYEFAEQQPVRHREVIERFGRHAHRNPVLERESTPEELEYIQAGVFPHNTPPPKNLEKTLKNI